MFKSRKIIAIVVAILTVLQVLPVMASDNMLKNSKSLPLQLMCMRMFQRLR